jgi:hypothetical protein
MAKFISYAHALTQLLNLSGYFILGFTILINVHIAGMYVNNAVNENVFFL